MDEWPGTPEERGLRRAQLIGKVWVSAWRADSVKYAKWMTFIRERTLLRDRWLWSPRYLEDKRLDESRAQVAGDALLSAFAAGSQSQTSAYWFNAAAELDEWAEGWLFDKECLREDGWGEATGEVNGRPWRGWRRIPG